MAKPSYAEQLRDPRWQKRRLEMLATAGWKCSLCGDAETTLHVHHKHYMKGRLAWEYDDEYLAVLCEPCHEREHAIEEVLKGMLACSGVRMSANEITLGLVCGFLSAEGKLHPDWEEPLASISPRFFQLGALASLLITEIEQFQPLLEQVQAENEVHRRALSWYARKPDGSHQNNQA
jgi:hypothetical protein